MNIAVLAGYAPSLVNFRGPLIREMVRLGHRVAGLAPDPDPTTARALVGMGASCRDVTLDRRGLNPVRDLAALLGLRRVFADMRPDVLFCYTIKPVVYGSWAARVDPAIRIFPLITGLGYAFEAGGLISRVGKAMYRSALSRAEAVFFQNPDDRDQFKGLGLLSASTPTVVTSGSGVDLERFAYVPLESPAPVFLCIARLLKGKGVMEYVQAARTVKERRPEAVFRLVGPADPGPDGADMGEIRALHEAGVVEYLGEAADVRPHLASASVYVLPSYREGTPRSVLEAMATGRAILTTDVPGCRQTVEPGVNGLLVPARDVPALAEAMERLAGEPGLVASMGLESRRLAEERFDVRKVNEVILDAMGLK